jgi:hypothetical protein
MGESRWDEFGNLSGSLLAMTFGYQHRSKCDVVVYVLFGKMINFRPDQSVLTQTRNVQSADLN